ncbi:MAG: extracellular solute-binding protein [Acidobacteriaceae bacterium]
MSSRVKLKDGQETLTYRALTWDHPRGFNALDAAAKGLPNGFVLHWDKQPLAGFEEHSIADLCAKYDLIVLDHPHIGEAVQQDCLLPIDAVIDARTLAEISHRTVGASFCSYTYAGRQWALPLDAATQVMASRTDLTEGVVPDTWEDVVSLASKYPAALSLAGPHAILTLFSIAVSFGADLGASQRLFPPKLGEAAMEILDAVYQQTEAASRRLNPIDILEFMATSDDLAFCPLIYGYVNYATTSNSARRAISFSNAPRMAGSSIRGSILGGTGIGLSKQCEVSRELLSHLLWLSGDAQTTFIPAHDGQPSARAAWSDPLVNSLWGDFYVGTLETIEQAYVRPRYAGYIDFQKLAAHTVRLGLETNTSYAATVQALEQAFEQSIKVEKRK